MGHTALTYLALFFLFYSNATLIFSCNRVYLSRETSCLCIFVKGDKLTTFKNIVVLAYSYVLVNMENVPYMCPFNLTFLFFANTEHITLAKKDIDRRVIILRLLTR